MKLSIKLWLIGSCCALASGLVGLRYFSIAYITASDYLIDLGQVKINSYLKINDIDHTIHKEPTLNEIIASEASNHKLSPLIIHAVIAAESNFNAYAERYEAHLDSSSIGLMQVMRFNAQKAPCSLKHYSELFDPVKNIRCGTAILSNALKKHGTLKKALQAYNGGDGCFKSSKCMEQTTRHANKVLEYLGETLVFSQVK